MASHKVSEEQKWENLNKYIQEQKAIIAKKEQEIKEKNEKIAKMEDEYNDKLKDMREEYNQELNKKWQLDKELNAVWEELEKIEYDYPK